MVKKNLLKRISATVIDLIIYHGCLYVYAMYFGEYDSGTYTINESGIIPVMILWFLYFCVLEGTQGGTLGHLMMGLEVIKIKNEPVSVGTAFKRHIADPLDIYFWGLVAIVSIWNTEKHQRLGDLIGKTIVIDTGDEDQVKLKSDRKLIITNANSGYK